jgi:PHAX RNA-binding domain-containing protein
MDALTVEKLAAILREPNVPLLRQVLRTLGQDRTAAILTDTLQCETQGGMRTKDGRRRRTPGGVFFQLVKERATRQERQRLFPHPAPQQGRGQPPHGQGQPPQQRSALTWDEVQRLTQALATEPPGEARTMKLTLIGRPGKVETRGQAVVFRMQGKPPGALPRGLPPAPAQAPMTWNVMVALRQWNRVKDSLTTDQEDQLIIEGYPVMQGSQPVLLAQSCVSLLQQRAQKQAQRQHQAEPTP